MNLLLVTLGGGAGALSRYLVGGAVNRVFGLSLPYGTLVVNLIGSFALALLISLCVSPGAGSSWIALSPQSRLLLGTGFLGAFTTYSTFNLETLTFLQERAFTQAALYLALTLLGALFAGFLGLWLGQQLTR